MAARPECGMDLSFTEPCHSQTDGNILLQLLEFKTRLLEVVEELHIRRDAEERFEGQISALVLEKQELEWTKESLQHQMDTEKSHHTESVSKANKEFQANIRHLEEEKGRYQVIAEQKDKDIHNLKEELKSLQLLKYNLEKKLNELEQKLLLQGRTKDCHLNQLGEVEKRFIALSRKCAIVKQAHQKLEQNADEAIRRNKKLTSANEKQEATIESLNKEVDVLRNKLVKAKMSFVSNDKTAEVSSIKEHTIRQLHQRLDMEVEMNRKLMAESKALQAEKQEVLKSLQFAHQLLSNQTQTTNRLELDIRTQRQLCQSLEQDHKAMQVKEKAMEEKIKQLTEEYTVSKNNWDKERTKFLDQMKNEQQELVTVRETFAELHHRHIELCSKAEHQAEQILELRLKVKEQELTSIVEDSRQRDSLLKGSVSNMSNTVHVRIAAKDSDDVVSTMGDWPDSEADHNGRSRSEILFNPIVHHHNHNDFPSLDKSLLVDFVEAENITEKSSTMDEDASDLSSKSVTAEPTGNSVLESNSAHFSPAKIKELDFVNNNKKNVDQTAESLKDDGAMMSICIEKEKSDELKICENPKENVVAQLESLLREDKAQENVEDKEMSGNGDNAMDSTMFIVENIQKDLERNEESGSLEGERQSKITEATGNENHPQTHDNTQSHEQVSVSKPKALEGATSADIPQMLVQEMAGEEVFSCLREANSKVQYTSPVQSPATESPLTSVSHDSVKKTVTASEETTSTELPETLNKSSLCHPQNNDAQLDGVSIQETLKMQTQVVSPADTPGHVKDIVDNSAKECCSQATEDIMCPKSQPEIPAIKINLTDSLATACEMSKCLTNGSENNNEGEEVNIEQVNILDKSNLKCKQPSSLGNTKNIASQIESGQTLSKSNTKDAMFWPSEIDLKTNSFKSCRSSETLKSPIKKDTTFFDEYPGSIKMHRLSYEWRSCQRRADNYMTKSDFSAHRSHSENAQLAPTMTRVRARLAPATHPMFPRGKQNKIPLTITRATDVSRGSGVCGTAAASSWRLQPSEWKAMGEAHRDSAAPREGGICQSEASALESTSSGSISKPEEHGKRTLSSDADRNLESDWGPTCSQETEDQESSFRAQIAKIEQFLCAERLRLAKRKKSDNSD